MEVAVNDLSSLRFAMYSGAHHDPSALPAFHEGFFGQWPTHTDVGIPSETQHFSPIPRSIPFGTDAQPQLPPAGIRVRSSRACDACSERKVKVSSQRSTVAVVSLNFRKAQQLTRHLRSVKKGPHVDSAWTWTFRALLSDQAVGAGLGTSAPRPSRNGNVMTLRIQASAHLRPRRRLTTPTSSCLRMSRQSARSRSSLGCSTTTSSIFIRSCPSRTRGHFARLWARGLRSPSHSFHS